MNSMNNITAEKLNLLPVIDLKSFEENIKKIRRHL